MRHGQLVRSYGADTQAGGQKQNGIADMDREIPHVHAPVQSH